MSSPGLFRPRRVAAMSVPLPPAIRIPAPATRPRRAVNNSLGAGVVPLPVASHPTLAQPVPVTTPGQLPDVGIIPTPLPPGMAERDRYAQGEPSRATRLQEAIAYESNAPLQKMGRGRAFLSMALSGIGQSIQQAQATAAAQGRSVGWGDLAAGLGKWARVGHCGRG